MSLDDVQRWMGEWLAFDGAQADLIFDEALALVIAVFYVIKGLALRRRTSLGRALARNNFTLAVAYVGVFGAMHWAFFGAQLWRRPIRVLIAITVAHAIYELLKALGGWRGLWREIRLTLREYRDFWVEAARWLWWQARRCVRWLRRVIGARGDRCE